MYTTAHKKIRMTCFEAFWSVLLSSLPICDGKRLTSNLASDLQVHPPPRLCLHALPRTSLLNSSFDNVS